MSFQNIGNQQITFGQGANLNTKAINEMNYGFFPTGIYQEIEIVDTSRTPLKVTVKSIDGQPWFCWFNDEGTKSAVKIEFQSEYAEIEADFDHPYIILRHKPTGNNFNWFAEILAVSSVYNPMDYRSKYPDDVILGRLEFDSLGNLLPTVDYSEQRRIKIEDTLYYSGLFQVVTNYPPTDKITVKGGNVRINGVEYLLTDTELTLSPVTAGRYDLLYVDIFGNVYAQEGDDASPPPFPDLPEETYPIGVITRLAASDVVKGSDVTEFKVSSDLVITTTKVSTGLSGSNMGTAGVGVYDSMSGNVLRFRKLNPASNMISISRNAPQDRIDFDIVPANITINPNQAGLGNVSNDTQVKKPATAVFDDHIVTWDGTLGTQIQDGGVKISDLATASHLHAGVYQPANANIQTHVTDVTTNPHNVTKAQIGLTNVTDNTQINKPASSVVNNHILVWDGTLGTKVKDSGSAIADFAVANHNHDTVYEPIIASKGTAFNKSFGTTVGTVSEGNHLHTGIYEPTNSNIQTHIASTNNPHATSASQVGLGNVTNFAQLKRTAADFNSFTDKATPTGTDVILIEDSLDSYNKKKIHVSDITASVTYETDAMNIKMNGVSNAGVLSTVPRADHIHPSDTGKSDTNHNHDTVYEPIITVKESGFNLALGDTHGTVAEGDHSHSGVYEPANSNLQAHVADVTTNPHAVNATQVGLGNVDNTSDANKPISTATGNEFTDIKKNQALVRSTGLLGGGVLTKNVVHSDHFDLAAGKGAVVNAYTDYLNPTSTYVTWTTKLDQELPDIANQDTTYINLDVHGNFFFTSDPLTDVQRREYIAIGWADHTDRATIEFILTEPFYVGDIISQFNDYVENFGPFNIEGNQYGAYGTDLRIKRSAGKTFDGNANYAVDSRTPNIVTTDFESPVAEINYYYRDGSGGWFNDQITSATIDPNHWDDKSGVLQDVPDTNWTVQPVLYYSPTNETDIQYGQAVYTSYADAHQALQDAIDINPYNSYDTFRGWLIVKKGATNLSDPTQAIVINAGKLGLLDVSSGGGLGGEINTASNVGLSGVGVYRQKTGVNLELNNIDVASSLMTVSLNATNHTVVLGVNSGTTGTTVALGNHTHTGVYEPAIGAKGTAFNVSFETNVANIKMDGLASVGTLSSAAMSDHIHPSDTSKSDTGHLHTGVYEPVISSKKSAFNVDFGTSHTTVAYGDHAHSGVYEPAATNIQTHIASMSNPHSTTALQVGLGNVTNDAQVKKISSSVTGNFVTWNGITGDTVSDSGFKGADFSLSTHLHTNIYEPVLGTPTSSGMVLASTTGGVRSWVAMSGGGDSEVAYAQEIDFDGDYIYKGQADPGSATSAAVWRISRTYLNPADGDAETKWADGVGTFTKIWDNHKTTISYS